MLAAIDSLIPLLIFIAIGIISAILKKREPDENAPPMPPRRRDTDAPVKSWEEQLRDLLQSQLPKQEAPPPLPRSQIPPPIHPLPRREMPAPPSRAPERRVAVESAPAAVETLHQFKDANQHYAHAATLEHRVAQHMDELRRHPVMLTSASRHDYQSKHMAIELVRDPKNIRAAILAQVILGQPKAFE